MIYRFKISSTEAEGFTREFEIEHEQTYLEFHNLIQENVGYDNSQMASFYQIDHQGQRGREIALFEMNLDDDDNMNVVAMDVAMIREFVSKENPDMIYVFDFFSDRYFNIELIGQSKAKGKENYPICCKSEGDAPEQIQMNAEDFEGLNLGGMDTEIKTENKKTADDYLADFGDEFNEGPEFENLDDYEDIL